jgi:hypothetical protein
MSSVPPYAAGGTASKSGATCAIRSRGRTASEVFEAGRASVNGQSPGRAEWPHSRIPGVRNPRLGVRGQIPGIRGPIPGIGSPHPGPAGCPAGRVCYAPAPLDARRSRYAERAERRAYREADERRGGAVTPVRALLTVAVLVGTAMVGLGVVERGASQVPILVGGGLLLGASFLAISAVVLLAAIEAARDGSAGRSVFLALFGGGCTLAAAGCLGGAVVLALLYGSTPGA